MITTLALMSLLMQAPEVSFGEVRYPLFGNLRAAQGTIAIRFRIDEPLPAKSGTWYQVRDVPVRFSVATITVSEEDRLHIYWRGSDEGKGSMWTGMYLKAFPPGSPNLNNVGTRWKTGEVHTVAYTWDRDGNHCYYGDGELSECSQSLALEPGLGTPTADSTLVLGSTNSRNGSTITLLAVHILDHSLKAEALVADNLFTPQARTLLLDRFDSEAFVPDGKRTTRAAVITGYMGERGGLVTKGCHFLQTKQGLGLRLYTPPADAINRNDNTTPNDTELP